MWAGATTIIIEPRFIVRAALASLLESLKCRVICSVATTGDIGDAATAGEACDLAIVGALSAEGGAGEAAHIREVWPDCKTLLLLESASSAELQSLVPSGIDGCLPLDISKDTLRKALELIMVQKLRIMIAAGARLHLIQGPQQDADRRLLSAYEENALSAVVDDVRDVVKESGATLPEAVEGNEEMNGVHSLRKRKLSEREVQILDSLVKGHANKVIARACAISEATVKVHMKSILRKIKVANRTQAAVWALEHGYCGEGAEIAY